MEPRKLEQHQCVRVEWSDSSFAKGWHYPPFSFHEQLRAVSTVGFVASCTEEMLVLSASLDQDGGVLCPVFIPWHAIEAVNEVTIKHAN